MKLIKFLTDSEVFPILIVMTGTVILFYWYVT